MIVDFLLAELGWLPDSFGRGLGRLFRALAYLPVVIAVGIAAVVGMIWSWSGILRGSGFAMAVWFVAPLFAIGAASAWFDRQSKRPSKVVREQLAHLPPRFRNDPGWIFLAEMLRLDPAFRAVYTASGSGGVVWDIDESRLPEAVLALRLLPDDAGGEQVGEALARFRKPRTR